MPGVAPGHSFEACIKPVLIFFSALTNCLAPIAPQLSMSNTLLPIQAVARKLELPNKYFEQIGSDSGKVRLELLSDPTFQRRGKLIVVTATTPTAAGEGKTVTSISLHKGLRMSAKGSSLLRVSHRSARCSE